MNRSIEAFFKRLQLKKSTQEWIWFVVLWCTGLASVLVIAGFIKLLMLALK